MGVWTVVAEIPARTLQGSVYTALSDSGMSGVGVGVGTEGGIGTGTGTGLSSLLPVFIIPPNRSYENPLTVIAQKTISPTEVKPATSRRNRDAGPLSSRASLSYAGHDYGHSGYKQSRRSASVGRNAQNLDTRYA